VALTDAQLREKPFFRPGGLVMGVLLNQRFDPALFGSNGGQNAAANRDRYLAEAFPARTLPAGANALSILNPVAQPSRNIDMMNLKNGWPAVRGLDQNWRHSDLREVAYLRVHRFYDQLVTLGGLK
jgi:hypothetical protein